METPSRMIDILVNCSSNSLLLTRKRIATMNLSIEDNALWLRIVGSECETK